MLENTPLPFTNFLIAAYSRHSETPFKSATTTSLPDTNKITLNTAMDQEDKSEFIEESPVNDGIF